MTENRVSQLFQKIPTYLYKNYLKKLLDFRKSTELYRADSIFLSVIIRLIMLHFISSIRLSILALRPCPTIRFGDTERAACLASIFSGVIFTGVLGYLLFRGEDRDFTIDMSGVIIRL
jgi:hypothetical protein